MSKSLEGNKINKLSLWGSVCSSRLEMGSGSK